MAGVATGLTAPGPWTWYGGASWLLGRECNERQVPDLLMGTWSGLTWGSLCNSAWTWEKRKRKMRLKRLTRFQWQQCWPQSTVFMYQTTVVDDTTREGHDKLSVTQGNVCEDPRLWDRILSPTTPKISNWFEFGNKMRTRNQIAVTCCGNKTRAVVYWRDLSPKFNHSPRLVIWFVMYKFKDGEHLSRQ